MGASQSSPSQAAAAAAPVPSLSEKQARALETRMANMAVTDAKQKRPATAELTMDDVQMWNEAYRADPSKAVIGTLLR